MGKQKTLVLIITLVAIVGIIFWLESMKVGGSGQTTGDVVASVGMDIEEKLNKYPRAKEVDQTHGFINTDEDGITISELIGDKVVLLDIWTYSCINCQRTLPYLNAWYEKYKDQGLEIVAVHTPEFEFEKDINNVQQAVDQFDVKYPVVLDNDYRTWNAYNNRYWPRKYLIDIDGFVVYDHIGEGAYEETEEVIQRLLAERAERLGLDTEISGDISNPENVESVSNQKRSPEIYFGAWRNERLGNGTQKVEGERDYELPKTLKTSTLYFDGLWNVTREYAENTEAGASIVFKYQAQKVFMVASSDEPVRVKVLVDGEPVGDRAGADVDSGGYMTVGEEQLYRIIEDEAWGEHVLELIPEEPGLEAFTFTFG